MIQGDLLRRIADIAPLARESGENKRILFETTDVCVMFVREPAGSVHSPARHSVDELVIRLAGSSTFRVRDATVRLEHNGVLHVPAFVEHSSVVDEGADVAEIVVLMRNQFAGSFFSND